MGIHPGESRTDVLGPPLKEREHLRSLQERVGVVFAHPELLLEAMTHSSWINEQASAKPGQRDNERLEYLGDAVLELIVADYLFKKFPQSHEGDLTQRRAAMVNTVSLAKLAEQISLGDALLIGHGAEKTNARQLPSLLANAFEALIGATFLDQGYAIAEKMFLGLIGDAEQFADVNYKGRFQEVVQTRTGLTPSYRVSVAGGPGHLREYVAEAMVGSKAVGRGRGPTKQAAEQAAAEAGLKTYESKPPPRGHQPRPKAVGRPPEKGLFGALRSAARSLIGQGEKPSGTARPDQHRRPRPQRPPREPK